MTPRIHVYSAPADKFFVNSFIVETDTSLVLVDTQFLVSTARALRARLDALAKPLAAVIVTHPHPDHYNGLPVVLEGRPAIPVYANAATIEGIRATQAGKRAAWTPVYGDDYPTADGLPDHELGPDETLLIDGAELRLIDLGPMECADNTMIHVPQADALIASDLVYNGCHPWLAEHRTTAWLDRLDEVGRQFGAVATVYAGHGAPGTTALLDAQRRYIAEFRESVERRLRGGRLDPGAVSAVAAETRYGRNGWPLDGLVEMNIEAVATELKACT